jgi:tripartite-type tricarboxylate transporter receptor subunit TctC
MSTRTFIAAGAIAGILAGLTPAAMAQDYPTRRVSIIVPYAAGGATDILARQVADKLGSVLDQTVTVENRPGAGATLGTTQAAQARPDGYTLYMGQVSSHGIAPAVYENLQYDPVEDFQPITLIVSIPNVMVVSGQSPFESVEEFIEAGQDRTLTFGSSGTGSSIHLSGEMFKTMTGIEMTHVPFRGSGEAVPALMSGDVDVMFDNLPSAISHIRSGSLRALAVTTQERSEMLPDIPTISELGIDGLDGFEATSWFGLLAPSGIDDEVLETLTEAMNHVLADEDFVRQVTEQGGIIEGGSPADFASHIESELDRWAVVVEDAGVTVD